MSVLSASCPVFQAEFSVLQSHAMAAESLACLQSDGKKTSSSPWAFGSDKVFPLFLWQST